MLLKVHLINTNLVAVLGLLPDTHRDRSLTIPALAYYINILNSQSCGRGRGVPTYLLVGEVFYKIINYN